MSGRAKHNVPFFSFSLGWSSLEVGVPPPTSNKSVVGEGTPTTRENKLPNYSGTKVFRGIEISPSQIDDFITSYANGSTKTWNDFTSCGGSVQASFGGRAEVNVIFEIQHTTAKEITNLADGVKYSVPPMPAPEILIKAGSNFTVTAPPVFDNTLQKWIIKVTQTQ